MVVLIGVIIVVVVAAAIIGYVVSGPVTALDPFSSLLGTVLGAAPSPSLEA